MATFRYAARDVTGRVITGSTTAESEVSVIAKLQEMGYYVTNVEEQAPRFSLSTLLRQVRGVGLREIAAVLPHRADAGRSRARPLFSRIVRNVPLVLTAIDQFTAMGLSSTVDYLVDFETIDDSALETRLSGIKLNLDNLVDLQRWWLLRMIYTRRPLQEKMVLFWHGLLTSTCVRRMRPYANCALGGTAIS